MGYRRNSVRQYRHTSLIRVEGLQTRKDAAWYLGKRVAYLWKTKKAVKGVRSYEGRRVMWGKVTNVHGNNGALRVKFTKSLPPTAIGRSCRVFLYPSNI